MRHNTEALVVIRKRIGLEVNAEKTKYMIILEINMQDILATLRIDNKHFERVEQFRYLGTTLTNQNYVHVETKSILNICYHSAQNIFCYSLPSSDIETKICRTVMSSVTG
jgi:hypothetical protein